MSVINRMLSDLEQRGAPRTASGDESLVSAEAPPRRRLPGTGLFMAVLALVLLGLAVLLWLQRGERILADWLPSGEPAPVAAELVGVSFEGGAERPRLAFRVAGNMTTQPRWSRSGGSATLRIDAAANDLALPAPPREQAVFRGITLESGDNARTRIGLELAAAAEVELRVDGDRIVLEGRPPARTAEDGGRDEDDTTPDADAAETAAAREATQAPDGADRERETADAGGDVDTAAREAEAPASDEGTAPETTTAASGDGETNAGGTTTADAGATEAASGAGTADDEGTVRKSRSTSPEVRAQRRYREARQALSNGELARTRRLLVEALELDPMLHAARDLLVSLVRRAGDAAAARRLLAEGVERSPGRSEYAMPYARLLVDTGELDRAAQVLEGARAAATGSARYHALVAAVAQRRGEHRAAASEYTRALELDSGNGLWWLGLGVSLAAIDEPEQARAAFREARASGTLSESLDRWVQGRIDELGEPGEG